VVARRRCGICGKGTAGADQLRGLLWRKGGRGAADGLGGLEGVQQGPYRAPTPRATARGALARSASGALRGGTGKVHVGGRVGRFCSNERPRVTK
jgi:hypothetical protein